MIEEDDWRLRGQEEYLLNKDFRYKRFIPSGNGKLLDMLNDGGVMDSAILNEFIDYIEKQMYVQDKSGIYQKDLYVKNIIFEAKELIRYGERVIALENMLDNLCEISFPIDANGIYLIRKVFIGTVPERIEKILNRFMEK